MIGVECRTPDERNAVIEKALGDGHFVILSNTGALMTADKTIAMTVFVGITQKMASMLDEEVIIYYCKDAADRDCLAILPKTAGVISMYGITAEEFNMADGNLHKIERTVN